MSPALIRSTEDLCEDLFIGRDRAIFCAINRLWEDTEPDSIPLPLLVDKLDGKVTATYVASLLDGAAPVKPGEFNALVKELSQQRIAKAVLRTLKDNEAEIEKTGTIDVATLMPLLQRYNTLGEKDKVMSSRIREWVYQSSGEFSVSKIYADLGAKDPKQKGLVRAVVHKLLTDEIIVRSGKEEGHYRKVDKALEEVDLMSVVPEPMNLYLPLALDNWVKIYPKSVIVVAGSGNRGKTALAHDFIKHNMDNYEIHLFFSEGGVESLRDRLAAHQDKMIGEWRFKAYPRTANFEDAIFADAINVIDYMLVPDEFWKVGAYLDNVYRKLNKGIAYVNIQKDSKAEVGRGGEFGLERPQLYVTLSPDSEHVAADGPDSVQHCVAKILKAKAWKRKGANPDGKMMQFQIEDGWKILHYADWHYPRKEPKKREDSWFKGGK